MYDGGSHGDDNCNDIVIRVPVVIVVQAVVGG